MQYRRKVSSTGSFADKFHFAQKSIPLNRFKYINLTVCECFSVFILWGGHELTFFL